MAAKQKKKPAPHPQLQDFVLVPITDPAIQAALDRVRRYVANAENGKQAEGDKGEQRRQHARDIKLLRRGAT